MVEITLERAVAILEALHLYLDFDAVLEPGRYGIDDPSAVNDAFAVASLFLAQVHLAVLDGREWSEYP